MAQFHGQPSSRSSLENDLVADLSALTHAQMQEVGAFVKKLLRRSSADDPFSSPAHVSDLFLSLYAAGIPLENSDPDVKELLSTLRKHEEQRALMFREGVLGDFTWNFERDEVVADPTVFKLYGAEPIAGPVPGSWFKARRHPDDRAELKDNWFGQLSAGGQIGVELRVKGDDGVVRWIECRGIVTRDENGTPLELHGLNIDITARKEAELERRNSDARARSAEERLRTAVQFSCAAIWRWHADDDSIEWFGPVLELTGKTPQELNTFEVLQKIVLPADLPSLQAGVAQCLTSESGYRSEFRIVRPDGEIRWLAGRGGILRDATGRVQGLTGVNFDITDRKTAEEELHQSEIGFRQLTNALPQIIFTANAAGVVDYNNERFYQLSGFSPGLAGEVCWGDMISVEDRPASVQSWLDCVGSGQAYESECRMWDRHLQEHRWHLIRALPVRNADYEIVRWIGSATDIHDQKTAAARLESEVQSRTRDLLLREEQLEKSLLEKNALLREIHHRVKNNLQIVSSLLSMQAANAADSAAVAPLRDSERRIASMALIHEQLYGTDDMQTVDFAAHARALSDGLLSSMAQTPLITSHLDLQPVSLTINQAIPCALILNELLTNAFKYAYPHGQGGEIKVYLSQDSGVVTLAVSDQGAGIPTSVDPFAPKTLGMEIVQVLVHQLDGELVVGHGPGASFAVRFRPQENVHAADEARFCSAALTV